MTSVFDVENSRVEESYRANYAAALEREAIHLAELLRLNEEMDRLSRSPLFIVKRSTAVSDQPDPVSVCLSCGQAIEPKRLRCGNCRQPIGKRDKWTHDQHSRAVHVDCSQPTGFPAVIKT